MENQEDEKEFGEFGEIAIRNCFMCGKTIRKSNCYEFERGKSTGGGFSGGVGKHNICLKCLLKGLYGICKSKEEVDKYLDLYIKIGIVDNLIK